MNHECGLEEERAKEEREKRSDLLFVPFVAWPTLGLLMMCMALFYSACFMRFWASCAFFAAALYGAFTVLHDSVHLAVSRNRLLNRVAGTLAALFFLPTLAGWSSFRWLHLRHHKHTNSERDPDGWTHRGGVLAWATLDYGYYVYLYRFAAEVPRHVCLEVMCNLLLLLLLLYSQLLSWSQLLHWFGGLRATVLLLGLFFDFIPHAPFLDRARFGNTLAVVYPLQPLMHQLLLAQDLHVMHHLYPTIPFYRYQHALSLKHDELATKIMERDALTWSVRPLS